MPKLNDKFALYNEVNELIQELISILGTIVEESDFYIDRRY